MSRWIICLLCALSVAFSADLAGTWKLVAKRASGRQVSATLVLTNTNGTLSGSIGNDEGSVPLDEVKLEKEELTVKFQYEGSYTAKMKLEGDALTGTYSSTNGDSGTLRATR